MPLLGLLLRAELCSCCQGPDRGRRGFVEAHGFGMQCSGGCSLQLVYHVCHQCCVDQHLLCMVFVSQQSTGYS
jgi:hypothetical protein